MSIHIHMFWIIHGNRQESYLIWYCSIPLFYFFLPLSHACCTPQPLCMNTLSPPSQILFIPTTSSFPLSLKISSEEIQQARHKFVSPPTDPLLILWTQRKTLCHVARLHSCSLFTVHAHWEWQHCVCTSCQLCGIAWPALHHRKSGREGCIGAGESTFLCMTPHFNAIRKSLWLKPSGCERLIWICLLRPSDSSPPSIGWLSSFDSYSRCSDDANYIIRLAVIDWIGLNTSNRLTALIPYCMSALIMAPYTVPL